MVRRRGQADEAGLKEGDVLLTVNDRTCRGLSCAQAMNLIESAGQNIAIRVKRGSEKPGDGVSRTASATGETTITSSSSSSLTSTTADDTVTLTLAQLPRRTHSVQDRHGQTVYIPSTDPVRVDLSGGSVTMTPGATADAPTPTAGAMSVSAPPGVEVRHDVDSRTFTLTFGLDDVTDTARTTTTTKVSSAQLIWQPPSSSQHAPAGVDVTDDVTQREAAGTAASRPPPLSRILTESTEEPPDTPTSPDSRKKKLYTDSAFYNDPDHKYPTVEEQIALARRVAQSVLAPANVNSRGHKMFVKRRERSVHWEAGYKPPEGAAGETDQDVPNALRPEPLSTAAASDVSSGEAAAPGAPPPMLPLTSFVFAPKLPDSAQTLDAEKLDALSSEELERVLLMEKKSTHTAVAPQVCFNLADDLRNMKGKGARLFAKRQAKSESWAVSADDDDDERTTTDTTTSTTDTSTDVKPSVSIQEKLTAQHRPPPADSSSAESAAVMPVNRLKEMVELPRPAMSPWEAAAKYGTVDPAFTHLSSTTTTANAAAAAAVTESTLATPSSSGGTSGATSVKSWSGEQPDPAASLAAAMTSSLKLRSKPSSSSSLSSAAAAVSVAAHGESNRSAYQQQQPAPVKFSAASS